MDTKTAQTKKKPMSQADKRRAAIRRARERQTINKAAHYQKMRDSLAPLSGVGPEQAAVLLDVHCQFCGRLLVPVRIEHYEIIPGRPHHTPIWPDYCGCEAEQSTIKQEQQKQELSAAQLREQARIAELTRAGLVGWLAEADFDQFQPRADWPGAMDCKERAVAYFDTLENNAFETATHPLFKPHKKNWLILYGHYGCGKTLLSAAMVKWYTGPGRAYFRVWPDYERRIRATYSKDRDGNPLSNESEDAIIQELQKGEFVVIDDLDKRKSTDFTRGVLYSVLNYRYNAELPTALTFNFGPDEADPQARGRLALESILGPAVLDRIIGSAFDVIDFDGPSYRSGVRF